MFSPPFSCYHLFPQGLNCVRIMHVIPRRGGVCMTIVGLHVSSEEKEGLSSSAERCVTKFRTLQQQASIWPSSPRKQWCLAYTNVLSIRIWIDSENVEKAGTTIVLKNNIVPSESISRFGSKILLAFYLFCLLPMLTSATIMFSTAFNWYPLYTELTRLHIAVYTNRSNNNIAWWYNTITWLLWHDM